ncbi:MAG: hypothetical protein JRI62_02770, partial [Deltaproteobacteria bacterium]|nr:hypothetical protein [Deltaproteobacteria bacterium]
FFIYYKKSGVGAYLEINRYFEVIPGMSAFNAASAALKRTMTEAF